MRGAYAFGALKAIKDLGLRGVDFVTGSSASAANLTYYASGQLDESSLKVWTEGTTSKKFLNPWNLLIGKYIVDINYLFNEWIKKRAPLDLDALRKSKTRILLSLLNVKTGKPVYFDNRSKDFLLKLKATMTVSLTMKKGIKIEGKEFLDGGLYETLPNPKELKSSTKIVILTKPEGIYKGAGDLLGRIMGRFMRPVIKDLLYKKEQRYRKRLNELEADVKEGKAFIIRPKSNVKMSNFDNRRATVDRMIKLGYKDVLRNKPLLAFIKKLKTKRPDLF